ncbi:MAG: DUF1257 domain-containing protein [Anaerolineae bacterium]|nr:DUF1257 domain-containing protein [Anaerolineales bacterium]MCQ3978746.1 hypothetical protein [Anaerolineae bacterium]
MSHFTRIKTHMVEKQFLLQALEELGYTYEEGEVDVRGFAAANVKAEIKVRAGGLLGREIGFRKTGESYEIVADWWGIGGPKREEFQQQVTQRYAYHAARAKLKAQGFNLVTQEEQDGQIRLVLRRVA